MKPLTVVIAGGGTGGHLYPGIAVARELLRRVPEAVVTFAGTARGIEARVVPREGFELDLLRSAGAEGNVAGGAGARARCCCRSSGVDAWRILSKRRPDIVLGVGGYSSGPVVLAAADAWNTDHAARAERGAGLDQPAARTRRQRRGRDLRIDSVVLRKEGALSQATRSVRSSWRQLARKTGWATAPAARPPRVLIFGGSQGAHAINMAMVEAAPRLADGRLAVTHQTGERDLESVRAAYRKAGLDARVEPFLYEMDREMTAADVVVCRAGATTLAELTAAGKAAVLIPLPTAADDHQRKNAEVLVGAGAAEMIEQKDLSGEAIAARIAALVADAPRRARMATAARAFARPDAARVIVDRALELAGRERR